MYCDDLDERFLKTISILYVEDDAHTREQFGLFLQRHAGKLITAGCGTEGLAKFIDFNPQVVITDILMPEMDGLEMSRNIRELDRSVPIIVTTAFEQTDFMIRAIDIGVDRYVVKPVNFERLYAALLDCAHRLRAEEQLRRQRRLEAEAQRIRHLESINMLAGGMAHDFNNLLQSILGFVYLAKASAEPGSKVMEFLGMADNCSVPARELAERLMLVAGCSNPARHNSALEPIIQSAVTGQLHGTAVTAEFDIPGDLPFISCKNAQLQEVMTQLTRNSLEAMPAGGRIGISVALCKQSDREAVALPEGDYLQVTFTDSGSGIAPDHLPKIFTPYFSTRNIGREKGMGLGLAICDTIVRQHGGVIRAESTPGGGAVFHIWLPVANTESADMDMELGT